MTRAKQKGFPATMPCVENISNLRIHVGIAKEGIENLLHSSSTAHGRIPFGSSVGSKHNWTSRTRQGIRITNH